MLALCSLAQLGSLSAQTVEALISVEAGTEQCPVSVPSAPEKRLGHSTADGTKKRKRLIPWPFAGRPTSANGDCPGQPDAGLKRPLFGQPLAALCGEEETLPQPVQDLLAILYREGPATEGIFRKAASEKARRDLKEDLNRGGIVDLESQPVHFLAAVLKDFLRNIPSQLLSAALYDKWMLALERPSREEKTEELKEVVGQLPRLNLILLKPLLAVLHRISQSAETSRMNSRNLAICIGPNLLSPGMDCALPLQVQKEMKDKVTVLVELLIENCTAIFGEDVALAGSPSAEEAPVHTGSFAAHPGAAQEDLSAHYSPEHEAACGPPTSETQQPQSRSPSESHSSVTCLSAPPLPPVQTSLSTMGRSCSEPALFCQQCRETCRRDQQGSTSADSFPVGQQQLSLEEEAQEKTPALVPAQLSNGSTPQMPSRGCPESSCPASQGPSITLLRAAGIPVCCLRAVRTARKRRRRRKRRRWRKTLGGATWRSHVAAGEGTEQQQQRR
nr:T-cell activation Rho GTPase-activating protein-like [Dromaius novaehollandiae]